MVALQERSRAYVAACQSKAEAQIAKAQSLRRAYPDTFDFDPKAVLSGKVIFLRRSDEDGQVTVMGRRYLVSAQWPHRLVRAEVDFTTKTMEFYALRRAAPTAQPLLHSQAYERPAKGKRALRSLRDGATRGKRLDGKRSKP